ncbi:MAG TPA: thioredoxin [Polyangiaceae bacterium]|nr:thioredoxin [Polyangiaceae bacterium]
MRAVAAGGMLARDVPLASAARYRGSFRTRSLAMMAAVALGPACRSQGADSSARSARADDAASAGARGATASGASASSHRVRFEPAPPGDVAPAVRDFVARATSEGRRPLVYVGATWCEPCRRFHDAAERGDLDGAIGDVTLLEFDEDRDGERLAAAGYGSRYVPLFAVPAADGSSSPRRVEGAIKGEGAVAFILPRLLGLLGR